MEKFYFKLEELVKPESVGSFSELCREVMYRAGEVETYHENLYAIFCNLQAQDGMYFATSTDESFPTSNSNKARLKMFIDRVYSTGDRYLPILEAFEQERHNLLKELKTEVKSHGENKNDNTTINNDTPQTQGSFLDKEHASNAVISNGNGTADGTTTTTYAAGTPAQRLQELFVACQNIMALWVSDLKAYFIVSL